MADLLRVNNTLRSNMRGALMCFEALDEATQLLNFLQAAIDHALRWWSAHEAARATAGGNAPRPMTQASEAELSELEAVVITMVRTGEAPNSAGAAAPVSATTRAAVVWAAIWGWSEDAVCQSARLR